MNVLSNHDQKGFVQQLIPSKIFISHKNTNSIDISIFMKKTKIFGQLL